MLQFSPILFIITTVLALIFLFKKQKKQNKPIKSLPISAKDLMSIQSAKEAIRSGKVKFQNRFQNRLFIYGKVAHSHGRVKFWRYYSLKK